MAAGAPASERLEKFEQLLLLLRREDRAVDVAAVFARELAARLVAGGAVLRVNFLSLGRELRVDLAQPLLLFVPGLRRLGSGRAVKFLREQVGEGFRLETAFGCLVGCSSIPVVKSWP